MCIVYSSCIAISNYQYMGFYRHAIEKRRQLMPSLHHSLLHLLKLVYWFDVMIKYNNKYLFPSSKALGVFMELILF